MTRKEAEKLGRSDQESDWLLYMDIMLKNRRKWRVTWSELYNDLVMMGLLQGDAEWDRKFFTVMTEDDRVALAKMVKDDLGKNAVCAEDQYGEKLIAYLESC